MPNPRILDFTPQIQDTPLSRTLDAFSQKYLQNKQQDQEVDALEQIYAPYRNKEASIEDTFAAIQTNRNLSPTARLNATRDLLNLAQVESARKKAESETANKQEKSEQEDKQLRALERARGLPEGALNEFRGNVKMAEQITRPSKEAKVPISNRPVEPEQAAAIEKVLRENPDADPNQLGIAFNEAGVYPYYQTKYLENARRKFEAKTPGDEYQSLRVKDVAAFVKEGLDAVDEASEMDFVIDTAEKALQGDITGPGLEAFAKNNPYGQLILGLTPDESTLQSANKKLLEGTKSIFGNKPTEREIFLLLNSMLPSIGKTKEANLIGLEFIKKINQMKKYRAELISDLTDGGQKYVPDVQKQVTALMQPHAEQLRKELAEAQDRIKNMEKEQPTQSASPTKGGKIRVRSPDGRPGLMTQEQIDKARAKGRIYEPI